ncbi:MAG: hypothetical protein LBK99_00180, partial [Opitutaceae bacterium]|nr:hypothetical protein [Opitutaceae bacterium]
MKIRLVLMSLLMPIVAGAATPSSFVWLETPQSTNFPDTVRRSILSEGKAPGVTSVKDVSRPASFFVEYAFEANGPGGGFELWGYSYDPGWSSPARWRIDNGAWQNWSPGPAADRQVSGKTFVMQWHRWGQVELPPGPHRLRVELTGPRPQGGVPFFVLDALLLARREEG